MFFSCMKLEVPLMSFSVSLFSLVLTKTVELSRFPFKKQSSSPSSTKEQFSSKQGFKIILTLTRPIGLPPHAPVAQKIADQR